MQQVLARRESIAKKIEEKETQAQIEAREMKARLRAERMEKVLLLRKLRDERAQALLVRTARHGTAPHLKRGSGRIARTRGTPPQPAPTRPAPPCLALLCLALPCLALPCLALPCLALPCLFGRYAVY
jgi:hypothetical protein